MVNAKGDIYEGMWLSNKAHGLGMLARHNGSKYKGEFRNDMKCGYGTEEWRDGTIYYG
jgi:hypothetical protein